MLSARTKTRFDYTLQLLADALHSNTKDEAVVTAIHTGAALVSEVYRVQLSEDDSSVVAKIPNLTAEDEANDFNNNVNDKAKQKERAKKLHHDKLVTDLHNREVHLYRYVTVHSNLNMKIPKLFHGNYLTDATSGLLIMEDLTDLIDFDQKDCYTLSLEQIRQVMSEVAQLQSIELTEAELTDSFPLLYSQLETLSNCVFLSANILYHFNLEWFDAKIMQKIMRISEIKLLKKLLFSEKPVLVHGNLCSKSLLWTKDLNLLAITDWTGTHAGSSTIDLATLIGLNLTPEDRRSHQKALIQEFIQIRVLSPKAEEEILAQFSYSLKFALLKLLIVVVTNPEKDFGDPEGELTTRLRALIQDVL